MEADQYRPDARLSHRDFQWILIEDRTKKLTAAGKTAREIAADLKVSLAVVQAVLATRDPETYPVPKTRGITR